MFLRRSHKSLYGCMAACLLGLSPAITAATTSEVETIKACQTAQAMFSMTTSPASSLSISPGETVSIIYSIVNHTTTLNNGLTPLATNLVPNDPKFTVNVINGCTTALAAGGSCTQTVKVTASNDIELDKTYALSAFVCNAGSPTKYCANTCNPFVIQTKEFTKTTLTANPNPLLLVANASTQNITVTNIGQNAALNINTSTPSPDIGIVVNSTCPASLAPNASCQIQVTPGATAGSTSFNIQGDNLEQALLQTVDVVTPPPTTTVLSANLSQLALSGLGGGISRQITITNDGLIAATGLSVNAPGLPTGTTFTDTCSGVSLAPAGSCTVTFTPGTTATSACDTAPGSAPIPAILTVNGGNVFMPATSDIYVLKYGCIFEGGYVFSINDSTPDTVSVGGVVFQTSDELSNTDWNNSNASPAAFNADISGINEDSTSPPDACNGNTNGYCNTETIVGYYSLLFPAPIEYAAYACANSMKGGVAGWFLPAICQMSYGAGGCGTSGAPVIDNIQSNLVDNGIGNISSTSPQYEYWSSTQYSVDPTNSAWKQIFGVAGGTPLQINEAKYQLPPPNRPHLRCIRTF